MAVAIPAAMSAAGCTTHQCDPSSTTLGADGGFGSWDLNCSAGCTLVWRSGPIVGSTGAGASATSWVDFPGAKTYTFVFPPLPPLPAGASVDPSDFANLWLPPLAWVAFDPPSAFGALANFAQSTGTEVEFTGISPTSLSVYNPSCQDYGLIATFGIEVSLDGGSTDSGADIVDP